MNHHPSVSVVVPVYNEIELVEDSVRAIDRFLAGQQLDYEVIIIESGSTDGSDAACDRLADALPGVEVIHETQRNGLGSALRQGYAAASKDLVWLVTVDIPFPLGTLCEALPLMQRMRLRIELSLRGQSRGAAANSIPGLQRIGEGDTRPTDAHSELRLQALPPQPVVKPAAEIKWMVSRR